MTVEHLSKGGDDGTTLGQSTTDKVSLYGVTPVVQPASASQAVAVATTTTKSTTLNATAIDAIVVLVNQLRSDLVDLGAIKGSA